MRRFTRRRHSPRRRRRSATFSGRTTFDGIRVRRFFLAHVLAELALDAVLLRADPTVADGFYAAFADADFARRHALDGNAVGKSLPELPGVLTRFARSRYLYSYAEDEGVATGLSRVCARGRGRTRLRARITRG